MTDANETRTDAEPVIIIGIGSSAGGLEAVRELTSHLPARLQAAYVIVQHMSPNHKSLMTELVARETDLEVETVIDGARPRANVVYITPPRTDVIIEDGLLRLVEPSPEPASPKPSVDRFFRSLADEMGAQAFGVVLSGTGSDGAYGVQAIRGAGGITVAQDDESAKYNGMPQAAIQTGCVDLVLAPGEIGTHLYKILSKPRNLEAIAEAGAPSTPYSDLLQILLARTRVDFRDYKPTTVSRRIERRMIALGMEDIAEYTEHCRENPQAVEALFKDLLISVTRFFRDREEFFQLESLLPRLIEEAPTAPLRIWIAGCATGEEAYTIAMLLSEAFGGPSVPLKANVQIFATDIDKNALTVARQGFYSQAVLNDIPSHLAEKYLMRHDGGVRVIDSLRNAILFSEHNVCQDPPFQKVDLICCRNLLIYFNIALQARVLARFHYALVPQGLLFLGTAESISGSEELFAQGRDSHRVFVRRALSPENSRLVRRHDYIGDQRPRLHPATHPEKVPTPSPEARLFDGLVQSLGHDAILVGADHTIERVYGNITEFIEMTQDSRLRMHLDLLRSPLREEARSLVTVALKQGSPRSGVRHMVANEEHDGISLDVYPILAPELHEAVALVTFKRVDLTPAQSRLRQPGTTSDDLSSERIEELEGEVASTREALQQTIEELETSNEELQSLNEELQSTNEELQAANEELETSNEELQSTNEELITVNEELQVTASELSGRTSELSSILANTPLPILVTDTALQLTQATTEAAALFSLNVPLALPHISQASLPEGFPPLAPICNDVIRLGTATTKDFISGAALVRMVVAPFFDSGGRITGVTLTFTELPRLGVVKDVEIDLSDLPIVIMQVDGSVVAIGSTAQKLIFPGTQKAASANVCDVLSDEEQIRFRSGNDDLVAGSTRVITEHVALGASSEADGVHVHTERHLARHLESSEPLIVMVCVPAATG